MELSEAECRVLGALIEKELATPQNYPLTLNALRLACNQSTNRDPVVDYDDRTIEQALVSLREQGLTRIVYSTSNRAAKYRHVLDEALHFGGDELAVLAVLLVRGPQTVGEIKGRTERLVPFDGLEAVLATLERLQSRYEESYVVRFDRRPGQKDARWTHLLAGEATDRADSPILTEPARSTPSPGTPRPTFAAAEESHRIGGGSEPARAGESPVNPVPRTEGQDAALAALAHDVETLRAELDAMRSAFEAFRAEFG